MRPLTKLMILGFILIAKVAFCDTPITDIIEVLYKNKKYYVAETFMERGVLKNHDLCYYDYNGEYIGEVYDIVNMCIKEDDSIALYATIERINIAKLNCYSDDSSPDYFDNVLKKFDDGITISGKKFKNNFKLLDAYHGNIGLYRFTEGLKESDNIWIDNNKIENLFCLRDQAICTYGFFAIRGRLNSAEKNKLKKELVHLLSSEEFYDKFLIKVEELYKKQIIMVGHCSC
jgi:hypothetical protein